MNLLPCPFCGGEAESDLQQGFARITDGKLSNQVAIYCTKCTVQMSMCYEDFPEYSPNDLLTILAGSWNVRTTDEP